MILEKLTIINYKNIPEATLELSEKVNCLIGHNGEGKTNMLDAIYYLSFCHSAFNSLDSQLIRHDQEFMMLEGSYKTDCTHASDQELLVSCGLKRGQKKHFKRNKKEYKRLSEHIGLIPIVMISPKDNWLIEGGSEERRRLLDVSISQLDRNYINALNRYSNALQQRNTLLRQEEEPDVDVMAIWEEQMAAAGETIFRSREAFVSELAPLFQQYYERISVGHEQVSLSYTSHCQRGPLLDIIGRDRWKDRAVGYSLHGIHRDDLEILLDGHQMKREGSQGQLKTFVIALKMAQFGYLCRHTGDMPLLLLDDIFDKLDARRVEQIIGMVSGDEFGQIFITDTNREHLDRILAATAHDYRIFNVEKGEITQKQ